MDRSAGQLDEGSALGLVVPLLRLERGLGMGLLPFDRPPDSLVGADHLLVAELAADATRVEDQVLAEVAGRLSSIRLTYG